MADTFKNVTDKTSPSDRWYLITPDDDTDLNPRPRAVLCTAEGTLQAVDAQGVTMPVPMATGTWVPIRPDRVGETSTGTFYALY